MNKQNVTKSYTKSMLIRDIAEKCFLSDDPVMIAGVKRAVTITSAVYNALEAKVKELLACAAPGVDIVVKMFEGISLKGKYVPEITKQNNLTGEMMVYKAHVKPDVQFSKRFRDSLIVQD